MANGQININKEKISDIADQFGVNYANSMDAGSQVIRDFSDVNSCGILSKTINSARDQMEGLSTAYKNAQNTISGLLNEFDYDDKTSKTIDDIDIPQDFVANDSMQTNYYESFMLSKLDGNSVNNGKTSNQASDIDESSIAEEAKLQDITKKQTEEEELEDSYTVQNEKLGTINQENETQEEKFDDQYNIQNEELKDINSDSQTQEQTYDDSSVITNQNINHIENESGNVNEYDDSSSITTTSLDDVNNPNPETPPTIDSELENALNNLDLEEKGDNNDIES